MENDENTRQFKKELENSFMFGSPNRVSKKEVETQYELAEQKRKMAEKRSRLDGEVKRLEREKKEMKTNNKPVPVGKVVNKEGLELTIINRPDESSISLNNMRFKEFENNIDRFYVFDEAIRKTKLREINCMWQPLTHLYLPEGIEVVRCHNSNIKELTLPNTIKHALCNYKTHVTDLEKFLPDEDDSLEADIEFVDPNSSGHIP